MQLIMPRSQLLSKLRSPKLSKWIPWTMFSVALVGFTDAAYITIKEMSGQTPVCNITHGCETVLNSSYAQIAGVPVAVIGGIFYLGMIFASFLAIERKNTKALWLWSWVSIGAVAFTGWMVYVQLGILDAICQWCMLSAITSTILFVMGMVVLSKAKK